LADIEGLVAACPQLDWARILSTTKELAEFLAKPEIVNHVRRLKKRLSPRE